MFGKSPPNSETAPHGQAIRHEAPRDKLEGQEELHMPRRVVFVCIENSNRSQMAQAFARMLGGADVEGTPREASRAEE